jgi:hypothetical protein
MTNKQLEVLFEQYETEKKINGWEKFIPYVIHNTSSDEVGVYLKDSSFFCEPLNEHVDVYKSFDTGEIVGVKIKSFSKVDKL